MKSSGFLLLAAVLPLVVTILAQDNHLQHSGAGPDEGWIICSVVSAKSDATCSVLGSS
jgi:hypothetical protein